MRCDDCNGKGWELYTDEDGGRGHVERCDTCAALPDDTAATMAAEAFIRRAEGRGPTRLDHGGRSAAPSLTEDE